MAFFFNLQIFFEKKSKNFTEPCFQGLNPLFAGANVVTFFVLPNFLTIFLSFCAILSKKIHNLLNYTRTIPYILYRADMSH